MLRTLNKIGDSGNDRSGEWERGGTLTLLSQFFFFRFLLRLQHRLWMVFLWSRRDSPGARDQLWPSRLLGKLANFNFTRIIPWTLVVNAGVAMETLEWAVL